MNKKLPTKKELMEELERDAKVIRKHFPHALRVEVISDERYDLMCIEIHSGEKPLLGINMKYRQEIQPPAKWEPVFVRYKQETTILLFSLGTFDEYGLKCMDDHVEMDCQHEDGWSSWCSINKRDHHSEDWCKEWEPEDV